MKAVKYNKIEDMFGVYVREITAQDFAAMFGAYVEPKVKVSRPRVGSGARFRELIAAGKSNAECVEIVRAEFPTSRATISDAAWNRNQLKKFPAKYTIQ